VCVSEILKAKSRLHTSKPPIHLNTPHFSYSKRIRLLSLIIPIFPCNCICIFSAFPPFSDRSPRSPALKCLHFAFELSLFYMLRFDFLFTCCYCPVCFTYFKLILVFSFRLHFNSIWKTGGGKRFGLV